MIAWWGYVQGTGVVSGEFGVAEAYQRKVAEIEPWKSWPKVGAFAQAYA